MKKMVKFGSRKRFNGEEGSEVSAPTARGGVPVLGSDEEQREFMEGMNRRSRLLTETKRSEDDPLEQVARMEQKKPTSFREAFAKARREGKDKFTFEGKSYTTELASSKPAASKSSMSDSSAPMPPMSAGPAPEVKPTKKSNVYEDRAEMMRGAGKKVKDFLSRMSQGHEFTGGGHEFGKKQGGKINKYASGGSVSSASKRADGIVMRGKTRGKMC